MTLVAFAVRLGATDRPTQYMAEVQLPMNLANDPER